MPVPGYTEQIIIAATLTLIAAWIRLLRANCSRRRRVICGLLAYFFPIVGPIAVLFLLSVSDSGSQDAPSAPRHAWANAGAG